MAFDTSIARRRSSESSGVAARADDECAKQGDGEDAQDNDGLLERRAGDDPQGERGAQEQASASPEPASTIVSRACGRR